MHKSKIFNIGHKRRLSAICLVWTAVIYLTLCPAITRAQAEYCEAGIKVGFQGLKIEANGPFTITFNNLSINGSGPTPETNKLWTKIVPGRTYDLTSEGTYWVHIKFDVPEGKKFYINDIETTEILSPGSVNSWKIRLESDCSCDDDKAAGSSSGAKLGSVLWQVSLGKLSDGKSARSISIREEVLSSGIYTPNALIYSAPSFNGEVDVVRNEDGSLRQIKAKQALADIIVHSSSEYDIKFYDASNVGAKDGVTGIYALTGQPFVVWKIKNPNPLTTERLQISKIQDGVTETSEYIVDSATGAWSLTTGAGTSIETKTVSIDPVSGDRTEVTTVKDNNNVVASKNSRTFHNFAWGEEIIREISDPDTAALTTAYTFYEDANESGKYGHAKTVTYPNGSWEKYDYDFLGNRTMIMRPWKDLNIASADESNSRVTIYTHYYLRTGHLGEPRLYNYIYKTEEKIEGVTVHKTVHYKGINRIDDLLYGVTETETVFSSASGGQTTVTTRYDPVQSEQSMWLADRISSVMYPDGRLETYTYEKGNFAVNPDPSQSTFVPDANGSSERQTITRSAAAAPGGTANKTTKETTIIDQSGRDVLQETYVYTGTGFERVEWTARYYDARGQQTEARSHNGTVISAVWTANQKTSEIDQSGIETVYTYDALKRIKTKTKKGVAASGNFPAQPDIVTTYNYDAVGRLTSQVVTAGSLSMTESTAYDLVGRTSSQTEASGLTTTYSYVNGGRTTTITLPGGATQIAENYIDGQAKIQSGTAIVPKFFDYGVNTADGTRYTQDFTGTTDATSPRWAKTTADWANRIVKVEKPGFTGTPLTVAYFYNTKGQLTTEQAFAGGSKLIADKLYEYDSLGDQIRAGYDIDGNGSLTLSSIDRITETDASYEKNGSDWFQVRTSKIYLTNNNSTATTIQTDKKKLNNFPVNGSEQTVSVNLSIDPAGNQTETTSIVDRTAKKTIATVDTPDSNLNALRISVNGLLQLSNSITPQTDTIYTYDAFGRLITVNDPQSGVLTKAYDSATEQLTSESQGSNTTGYEYYPSTHASAGRLKTLTSANNKKQYFNYNLRGDLIQTWGDTTYPLEYVYDSYGQRTELHTFRNGSGWTSATWSPGTTGTADTTKWIYHEPTGLLQQKLDSANIGPTYAYDALGRTLTRTWARTSTTGAAISTAYSYDNRTGEMSVINYSDATPDVRFGSDRGGRITNIDDAAGIHALTYNTANQILSHQIATGPLDGVTVTTGYDSFLRMASLQATRNAATLTSQTNGYDATSRLQTVTSGSNTATYGYYPNSGRLNTVSFTGGTNRTKTYDTLGRLQSVANNPASGGQTGFTYTYNNLNQRTRSTQEDNSYWSYNYNDRGEVVSGKKYWSDDTAVAGQQGEYFYDNIGNRTSIKSGGDNAGQNLRTSTYAANSLNQYSQRSVPGAIDVIGAANTAATVTVNNLPVYRRGDYFQKTLTVDNSVNPVYTQITATGARSATGTNGEDTVSQQSGFVYLPQANESFNYDLDGNLINDGRWQYAWDAENRLISMTTLANVPLAAKKKLEFNYDYQNRRIQKKVYSWNNGSSSFQLQSVTKYIYDGWNLIAELNGGNSLIRNYIWGRDLLMMSEAGSVYQVGFDGNENVTTLVKAGTGIVAASYEYDSFGNTLKSSGEYAVKNPVRFSGKYTDVETNLIYYGFRYYNPQTGGWLSRDPSGETGGVNLYRFLNNDGVNAVDFLGLWKMQGDWSGSDYRYNAMAIANCPGDSLSALAGLITGYTSDRSVLRIPDKVHLNQRVDVGPLLQKLEQRIRDNVVAATKRFNARGFGEVSVTVTDDEEAGVNKYFSSQPYGEPDCDTAVRVVLAKGLVDSLKAGEFNKFGYSEGTLPIKTKTSTSGNMLLGDSAWFPNYNDYLIQPNPGAYQAENVIKVGVGRFWGFTGKNEVLSEQQWQNRLKEEYKKAGGTVRRGSIPGYNNLDIRFVDVAKVAAQAFESRNPK